MFHTSESATTPSSLAEIERLISQLHHLETTNTNLRARGQEREDVIIHLAEEKVSLQQTITDSREQITRLEALVDSESEGVAAIAPESDRDPGQDEGERNNDSVKRLEDILDFSLGRVWGEAQSMTYVREDEFIAAEDVEEDKQHCQ